MFFVPGGAAAIINVNTQVTVNITLFEVRCQQKEEICAVAGPIFAERMTGVTYL